MALSAEIIAKLGLDSTGFSTGLKASDSMLTAFEARLQKFGVNFNPGQKLARESAKVFEEIATAEGRLAAVQADRTLRAQAGHRQEVILQREILQLKGAIDRMQGQTIAKVEAQVMLEQKLLQLEQAIATQSTKRASATGPGGGLGAFAREAAAAESRAGGLAKGMGRLVSVAGVLKGAFTSLVGIGALLFAPAIADRLARLITGFSKANEEALAATVEATGKAADAQEAQLADAQAREAQRATERAEMIQRQRDLYLEAIAEGKRLDAEKAAEEIKRLEEIGFAEDLAWVKEQDRLATEQRLRGELVASANLAQQAAYDTYLVEQKKTAEIQKQLDAIMQMEQLKGKAELVSESTLYAGGRAFGGSRNQRDIERASSDALQELIRRARADISFVEQTKGRGPTASADIASGFIIQGSIIARLQTDIQRAQFQLDQRNRAAADTASGGTAAARRNFQGDPLEFDRFYQQNGKALEENTALLRDLKTRLSQPLQVLAINQPSPFPR